MTREEKKLKRKLRADRRGQKNRDRNEIRKRRDYWIDDSSPTGYSQKCEYQPFGSISFGDSTCQYPCNGDC